MDGWYRTKFQLAMVGDYAAVVSELCCLFL
jgi:hypothetical protein